VKDVGLKNPYGVAVTDDGFIFVADSGNGRIVKL
jgi:DNA-binding beta-propeller fold protein YncE